MPSTYAHYRLGQQVRRELEGNERKIIEKYPQLYLIGLHGPDILFYYKPLRPNPVNQIGYDLHPESHGNPHLHRSYWSEYLRLPVYKKYNCRLSFFCLLKYKYLIEHTKRFKISFRCHLTRHKRSLECHPSVND